MRYLDDINYVASLDLPWDTLKGCNILVTGASGLIGGCIIDVLMAHPLKEYVVYAMGRNKNRLEHRCRKYLHDNNFHIISGDIINPLHFQQEFHYIIHAASGATPLEFANAPVEVMKANLQGVCNLLDYGICHGLRRMLYISSGEVYGEGDGRIFNEEYSGYVNPLAPRSCYPSSKRAAETLCVSYAQEYGVEVVIARPCHIYGPYFTENDNRVYAQFLRNVLHGENIVMKSSGIQYRSWCYIIDCVSAILHILFKGETGQAYNVANPQSNISIRELAEIIANLGEKEVIINLPSYEEKQSFSFITKAVFSTDKLEALGWEPRTDIKEGLKSTYDELVLWTKKYDKE